MIGSPTELKLSERTTVQVAELDYYEFEHAQTILAELSSKMTIEVASNADEEDENDDQEAGEPKSVKGSAAMLILSGRELRVMAVCSIKSLNGSSVEPLHGLGQYARVARLIQVSEMNALLAHELLHSAERIGFAGK